MKKSKGKRKESVKTKFNERKNIASKISIICAGISAISVAIGIITAFMNIRIAMACFIVLFFSALIGMACDFYIQGGNDNSEKK